MNIFEISTNFSSKQHSFLTNHPRPALAKQKPKQNTKDTKERIKEDLTLEKHSLHWNPSTTDGLNLSGISYITNDGIEADNCDNHTNR